MKNAKGKGKACFSESNTKKDDSSTNFEIEVTTSKIVEMNVEEPVVFEGENKEENTKEEGVNAIEEKLKNEENTNNGMKNEEKVEANSREKVNKSRKRSKKRMKLRNIDSVIAKDEDGPESSNKKPTKKVKSMGMIFMCSSKTKKDCYHYKVLGLPASKKDLVSKIYRGMRLFLFDIDLKLLYGIYKAAEHGGYNLEPKAFNSAFPSQVRFSVLEDCLPLAEEKFRKVIKDNYYTKNKFDCQLTSEQVKNLCKLFRPAGKVSKSETSGRRPRAEARSLVDRDRIGRRDETRHPALGRDYLYPERPAVYEREAFASPVARLPLHLPLASPPPPALPPSYVYRTLEADVYRRDQLPEHRDRQLLDLELRRRDETEYREPYIVSREPPLYRDPLYSAGLRPEYNPPAGLRPEYNPPAGLRPEYRHPVDLLIEYRRPAGQALEDHRSQPPFRY